MPRRKNRWIHLSNRGKRMNQIKRARAQASISVGDAQNFQQIVSDSSQTESSQSKGLDICSQIKGSLQKLRRQSKSPVPEESRPFLEIEVPPEALEHKRDNDEFVDELQPINESEECGNKHDPKENADDEQKEAHDSLLEKRRKVRKRRIEILPPLLKKAKRNPRRKVVLKRPQEEGINAARNAPNIEKVYLNTGHTFITPETNNKANLPEIAISFLDYKEQLYEFGKFVAEQLMTFDKKDAQSAQTEIKEVLTKYRLKYKIMKCLSKSGTSNVPITSAVEPNPSKATKPVISNGQPKPRPLGNAATGQSLIMSKPVPTVTTRIPATQLKSAESQNKHKKVLQTNSKKTYSKCSIAEIPQQKIQPTIQSIKRDARAEVKSGIPKVISEPAFSKQNSSTSNSGLSLVLMPLEHGSLRLSTARVNSDGTILTFPNAQLNVESNTPKTSNVDAGTSACLRVPQLNLETMVTHPLKPQQNNELLATQTVMPQLKLETVATQPTISEAKPTISEAKPTIIQANPGTVATQTVNLETWTHPTVSKENLGRNEGIPSLPHITIDPLMPNPVSSQSDSVEIVICKCEPNSDNDDDETSKSAME